jgi:hypothetical protein
MEADPRLAVVMGMVAFYCTVGYVAYNDRQVALATNLQDRALHLEHHKDALWWLLRATVLLLVLVLGVVTLSTARTYSVLFWIHESLDAAFMLLAALAIIFNGNRSVNHRYLGWSMVALTIPIGITGGILLYRLPMP